MKTILCVLDGGPTCGAGFEAALRLAKTMNAHVEALHVQIDPQDSIPLAANGMTTTMIEDLVHTMESESDRRAEAAREIFQATSDRLGLAVVPPDSPPSGEAATSFRLVRGREHDVVARWGMLFDLIVVTRRKDPDDPSVVPTLETAILETGRPVLVAPTDWAAPFARNIAVAWRETSAGVHALSGALDLLTRAETATVITVDEGGGEGDPAHVASYLAHYGVDAASRHVKAGGREAGQAILDEADKAGADLLVMGAYVHSRLRQFILGGVTRTVLRSARIPLLLAH